MSRCALITISRVKRFQNEHLRLLLSWTPLKHHDEAFVCRGEAALRPKHHVTSWQAEPIHLYPSDVVSSVACQAVGWHTGYPLPVGDCGVCEGLSHAF